MAQIHNPNLKKAALVIIGNEILSGRTHDSNAPWIAERLTQRGIVMIEIRVVPDDEDIIIQTIQYLSDHADYVFTTGGIGPTHDDITAESVAKCFGTELELHEEAYQILIEHYEGEDNVTPPRKKMAMIPKGASLIYNPVSAAPGFRIKNVHVMAGVPKIMQAMFDNILVTLEEGKPVLSNTITCSLQESQVAERLGILQNKYPDVDMGSYPHYRGGIQGLSLVVRTTDKDLLVQATDDVVAMIRSLGVEPHALSVLPGQKVVGV